MQNSIDVDEGKINLQELFSILWKHKVIIIVFILFFTLLSGVYAYFKPNIYISSASVKITINEEKEKTSSENILGMIKNISEKISINTEMDIIKSRMLIKKAIKNINFTHKYYIKHGFKDYELYKATPFEFDLLKGLNLSFHISPIDQKSYHLYASGEDPITKVDWEVDKIFEFGKKVKGKYFEFELSLKKGTRLDQETSYRLEVIDSIKAIDEIQKNLFIALASKDSSVIKISFEDTIAMRAYEFVNALAKTYLEEGVKLKEQEASMILDFIDTQLSGINSKLKKSEQNLEMFKKNSTMMTIGSKAEDISLKLGEYVGKIEEVKIQEEMLNYLYKEIQENRSFENISIAGLDFGNTGLPDLISKLQEEQLKLNIISDDYTLSYPKVKKITKGIEQYKNIITNMIGKLKNSISQKQELLEKRIKKYSKLMEALPEKEKIFSGLQRSFVVNEKIYSYLLEKRAVAALSKASTVSTNRILDTAIIADNPIKPNRKLIVMIGFMLGLIVGVILSFLREFMNSRFIRDEEYIKKSLKINIYGKLPYSNVNNKSANIKVFESPKSATAEAFRELRTNLYSIMNFDESTIMSVTSTVGEEGKTTSVINLAAILCLADKKVVIIDADMRKPRIHLKFKMTNSTGLSTLLIGRDTLDNVIQPSKYENIDVIPSGACPFNPSELIGNGKLDIIIEELKMRYDVIIFDTPPIGLVTDAMTLMKMSDISLYVVCAGKSKKMFLTKVQHMLKMHNIKNLGILLNCIKEKEFDSDYGYYEEH